MGAAAIYTPEGREQTRASIDYYRKNAQVIREGLTSAGLQVFGGVNAPYIWLKTPGGMGSWDFFDLLLDQANVATTPGAGFGPNRILRFAARRVQYFFSKQARAAASSLFF